MNGEAEDGAGEEELKRADDEDNEHLGGMLAGSFGVVVCRRNAVDWEVFSVL